MLATAIVVLCGDLVAKHVAFDRVAGDPVATERDPETGQLPPIPRHEGHVVVPKILNLQLTWNEGAVFGLGQGGRWFFIPFTLMAMAVIGWIFATSLYNARVLHFALGLVLAGAVGNLFDRLRFGAVRDFLWLFPETQLPFGWHWPSGSDELYPWLFNIADAALVVGVILLIVIMFWTRPATAE